MSGSNPEPGTKPGNGAQRPDTNNTMPPLWIYFPTSETAPCVFCNLLIFPHFNATHRNLPLPAKSSALSINTVTLASFYFIFLPLIQILSCNIYFALKPLFQLLRAKYPKWQRILYVKLWGINFIEDEKQRRMQVSSKPKLGFEGGFPPGGFPS